MTISFPRVGPGDVISSAFVNGLLDVIEKLDDRLTVIERGGPSTGGVPLVTGRIPNGDVALGSQLTLSGVDFLVPAQQNTVTIGNAAVTQFFAASTDRTLILTLPNRIPGVTLPAFLPIQVHNRNGDSNTLTVRVVPTGVVPQGASAITNLSTALGSITEGGVYTLRYQVDSATDIPETYLLSLLFTDVSGASEASWRVGAELLPFGPQLIARGSPLVASATITVPQGAVSAGISLRAESVHNDANLTTTSSPLTLAVGAVPDVTDPRVTVAPAAIGPAAQNIRKAVIDNQLGLEIRYGTTATARFDARFVEAGLYRFAAEVATPGGDGLWRVGVVSPGVATQESAGGAEKISFPVTSLVNVPSNETRRLVVRVYRRDAADASDAWQSFVTVPIRGFTA